MKIKSFKGYKHQERFETKYLKSVLIPPTKDFATSFKKIDEQEGRPVIECKFTGFGNIDSDRDILIKGCMAKSIQERGPNSSTNRKIAFLWQHDMKDPIGRPILIEEREDGAYAHDVLSDFNAVPSAKRAFSQLNDGTINQFSIGYSYVWDKMEYDEDQDAFVCKEIILYEHSVVTMGANEETSYEGVLYYDTDLKSYLKGLKEYNHEQFENIKKFIAEIEGKTAEPVRPLTDDFVFSAIRERIRKSY